MKVRLLAAVLALLVAPLARAQLYNHNPDDLAIGARVWGTAQWAWATCGSINPGAIPGQPGAVGKKQSPVDIVGAVDTPLPALAFLYTPAPFVVENNGHAVEVPFANGSVFRIGADVYELLQFHVHAPAEHAVGGVLADLEMHLVHRNAFGDLAVVGVLFSTALPPNPLIEQIIFAAPDVTGEETVIPGATIDATALLPAQKGYYAYTGSLTTPPCSEGVRWSVLDTPIGISQGAVDRMHELVRLFPGFNGYPNNNRPVQALNGRGLFHKK